MWLAGNGIKGKNCWKDVLKLLRQLDLPRGIWGVGRVPQQVEKGLGPVPRVASYDDVKLKFLDAWGGGPHIIRSPGARGQGSKEVHSIAGWDLDGLHG